ncbi:MAG TPA: PilZ domain-containing protein [Pyrinomonadaceae bacterium]|nr:PilZ domain-containing protein [Pyrinomonadaceae bacterium]
MAKQVTKFDQKSRRLRERLRMPLPARIYGRESGNREWTEMTRLVDVTPFGARFRLMRPVDIGRLLQLTLKMPHQLRVFDHVEDQYRVWSIVRNVRLLEQKTPKDSLLEVGVAFIGKRPPRSFEENPARRYEVAQTKLESQLWAAQEDSVEQLAEIVIDDMRKDSRQLIPVDVLIEVYDADKIVSSEESVTENISSSGATVFTELDLQPGTFVKMSNPRYNAVVLGVVRARRAGADGITRLHLEFIGSEWPL